MDNASGITVVQLRRQDGRGGFTVPDEVRRTLRRGAASLDADGVIADPQFTRAPK